MLETAKLFHQNAKIGAKYLDELINKGVYERGRLFREVVEKYVPKDGLILDYGCGTGRMAKFISEAGYFVEGYEPALASIEEARKIENKRLLFCHLDDFGDCLQSNKYDAIVCSSAIEFIELPEVVLKNFHRSLKAKGKLIISFSNRYSLWKLYYKLRFGNKMGHHNYQQNHWSDTEFKRILIGQEFIPISPTRFFESAFDQYSATNLLSRLSIFGTLGLVVAEKKSTF